MKKLALAVALSFLSACATYPPPKIENGCYHNYRYGFMLDLPAADWVPIEEPPPQLIGGTPKELRKDFMLALINKETDGMIVVLSHKAQLSSPGEILLRRAALAAPFFAGIYPEFKDVRYCYDPLTYLHYPWDVCMEFEHEDAISKSKGNIFFTFFPVGKKVNMIKIILSSSRITYEQNFPAFFKLVKSFKHGEKYTVSQFAVAKESPTNIVAYSYWDREERERLRQKEASQRPLQGEDKVASLPKLDSSPSNHSFDKITGKWWMEGECMVIEEMNNEIFIQMARTERIYFGKYRGTKHAHNISWDGKQLEFEIWKSSAAGDYKVFYALTLLDRNTLCGTKQSGGSPTKIEVEFKRR